MLGAVSGLSGRLWSDGLTVLAAILLAGAAAIITAGYIAASRQNVDGTTEVAALVVLAAGVLAGTGAFRLASGIVAATCLLLVEKSRLHALVRRLGDSELRAAARFGVMALVVLPLLPAGPYGPFSGIRPRELWALVLFFSGLSFLGYVARRSVGARHGYLVTGLLGGLVSSTNVTLTFARLSRGDGELARALASGAVAANAVLYARVIIAVLVLNPALVQPLIPLLAGPALVAAIAAAVGAGRSQLAAPCHLAERNPLQLGAALQMALLFQVVMVAVHVAREVWGHAGVVTSAAVLGLTDVDALTISMARSVAEPESLQFAAAAIAIGILANTVLKLAVVLVFGEARFRAIVDYATDRKMDLIVMGTHGRSGVAHLLMGSVAEKVVRTAPCPVMTVRRAPLPAVGLPEHLMTEWVPAGG